MEGPNKQSNYERDHLPFRCIQHPASSIQHRVSRILWVAGSAYTVIVAKTTGSAFLQRARLEAERYGTDPWVFVRELLQNARDAGAHRVWFQTSRTGECERVSCRDDGVGMTFDHAQRFLFSLYASSKRGRSRTAGRFGIGFWSVLRFEPREIIVCSRPQRGDGWQVRLDGQLEDVKREKTNMRPGTEVVLERQISTEDLEHFVTTSILRNAPWLRCRHRDERPLEVRVNGRLVRAEPSLPKPSMSFRRRGLRGIVGLGSEPRAEIFAHGFRVRDAATLDELLVEGTSEPSSLAGGTDGLSPRIIIDSSNLEVLMARGDAREDRSLRRLISVGHGELSRLVRAELDRHAGLSAPGRLVEGWREAWSVSRVPKIIAAVALTAVLGGLALWGFSSWFPRPKREQMSSETSASPAPPPAVPYRDLWGRYRGPDVDSVGRAVPSVDLSYQPSDDGHLFATLLVTGLLADGRPNAEDQEMIGPYQGVECTDHCLEVELGIDAPAGLLRLPIATGHVLDPKSVRLDDQSLPVYTVATGQPALWLDASRVGRLRYRSGPGRSGKSSGMGIWPALPPDVAEFAHGLEDLPISTHAFEAAEFVRQLVTYNTSLETAARHARAREQSIGLFQRAVAIGAGDCDVQNSLVVAILEESGIPSRLAVGWIGTGGQAQTGLHAWAEYQDHEGRWRAVDASSLRAAEGSSVTTRPPVVPGSDRAKIRTPAWVLPIVLTITLVVIALGFVFGRRRWWRGFQGGDADDIVGLLRGAAIRPRSFKGIHALFSRRLLMQVSGRPTSLARVHEMARKGRLACGTSRTELARRAARGGCVVLDIDQPESGAVAEVMAAVNLDQWQELLDRATGDELTAHVESRLAAAGEHCRLLVAGDLGVERTILDGTAFGVGFYWVVLDEGGRLWQSIHSRAGRWPARAALLLAEAVIHRSGAPRAVRHRCLSKLALEAMLEANEVCRG